MYTPWNVVNRTQSVCRAIKDFTSSLMRFSFGGHLQKIKVKIFKSQEEEEE
jgi:hypothetical protein